MLLEFAQNNLWVTLGCWVLIYISDYTLTLIGASTDVRPPQHISVQGSYELNPFFVDDINARRKISVRFIAALAWTTFLLAMVWLLGRTSPFAMRVFELTFGGMLLLELAIHMRHLRNIISYRRTTQPGEIRGAIEFSRRYVFWVSALDLALYALFYLVLWLFVGSFFFLGGALICAAHALRHRLRMRREPLLPTVTEPSITDGGSALEVPGVR